MKRKRGGGGGGTRCWHEILYSAPFPLVHLTEIQGAIINTAKWVLASLTAAVWMATDVGERVLFFLPKLELDFQDVHDFDGVISPDVARKETKIFDFEKNFFIFWQWNFSVLRGILRFCRSSGNIVGDDYLIFEDIRSTCESDWKRKE